MTERATPQAFISSYAPRLRSYANSLLTPVIPQTTAGAAPPLSRTTKRGTIAINYAEDGYDDDDFDSEGPRRPTGLRSRREDATQAADGGASKLGKEIFAPVEVQGIWRDWMGKPKLVRTDKQLCAQSALPLTLIPIRLNIDIPSYKPAPALPLPSDAHVYHINPSLPAYNQPEPTPPFRLNDTFLWNLHEALITPDQFATILIHDLDLPHSTGLALEISREIRTQLEQYAGVALHPLFHTTSVSTNGTTSKAILPASTSREHSTTPLPNGNGASTPLTNGNTNANDTPNGPTLTPAHPYTSPPKITSSGSLLPTEAPDTFNNSDDTYRCIITFSIHYQNLLLSDRFEWSLLHPPGLAERLARQTCADKGLGGEWLPAIAHAIYESVLRLKKEACESGGLVSAGGEIENGAIHGQEAGWRYDDEGFCEEWGARLEGLSREEVEKREGDRERQVRRLRRETARFSSSTGMMGGMPAQGQASSGFGGGYFDQPGEGGDGTPMGRGERSKRKRRFRSLSPVGRGGTPGGRGTPDGVNGAGGGGQGYGGGGGLNEWERQSWRCSHCLVHGSAVWGVRDGPAGPRSLCHNCGLEFERDKRLPPWSKGLHAMDVALVAPR